MSRKSYDAAAGPVKMQNNRYCHCLEDDQLISATVCHFCHLSVADDVTRDK